MQEDSRERCSASQEDTFFRVTLGGGQEESWETKDLPEDGEKA
jgi:hypothetical protein